MRKRVGLPASYHRSTIKTIRHHHEVQVMARRAGMSWEQSAEYLRNFAEHVIPAVREWSRPKRMSEQGR